MIAVLVVFVVLFWSLFVLRSVPAAVPAEPSEGELAALLREQCDVRREKAELTALVAELSEKYGVGRQAIRSQLAAYRRERRQACS